MPRGRDLLSGGLLVLAGWHLLAWAIGSPALPGPVPALAGLIRLAQGELWRHLASSLGRVLASITVSLVVGVPLGLVMGRSPAADRFLSPAVYLLYPVPKIVLLPVIMVLAGIGEGARASVIILVILFQIVVTTRDAARNIPAQTILSVRSLGANSWQAYRHVVWPAALPAILSGVRVSLGSAISVLFFAETVAGSSGLGYLILDAWHRAEYGLMFAAITAMSLMGLGLYLTLDLLERWLCRWRHAGG